MTGDRCVRCDDRVDGPRDGPIVCESCREAILGERAREVLADDVVLDAVEGGIPR